MLARIWETVTEWPIIVQGALGSAAFWIILKLLTWVSARVQVAIRKQTAKSTINALTREYIYRKYTFHDGLVYYAQGYFLTFSRALKFFLVGMLFFSLALLGGGLNRLFLSIGLIGAVCYFLKALSWVRPPRAWLPKTALGHWNRVAEIEKVLFGEAANDTKQWIEKCSEENRPEPNAPARGDA